MVVNLFSLVGHLTDASLVSWENTSVLVAIAYVAYLLSDLVLATIAFGLEPEENKRLLPWVLTQRFFYRQIYWMVALRSIATGSDRAIYRMAQDNTDVVDRPGEHPRRVKILTAEPCLPTRSLFRNAIRRDGIRAAA